MLIRSSLLCHICSSSSIFMPCHTIDSMNRPIGPIGLISSLQSTTMDLHKPSHTLPLRRKQNNFNANWLKQQARLVCIVPATNTCSELGDEKCSAAMPRMKERDGFLFASAAHTRAKIPQHKTQVKQSALLKGFASSQNLRAEHINDVISSLQLQWIITNLRTPSSAPTQAK